MIGDQIDVYEALGETAPATVGPDRMEVLLVAWLASYDSVHTRRAYRRDVETWLRWCTFEGVDPLAARRVHVDAWTRQGAGFTKAPAARSLARRLAALSAFYAYLVVEEVTDRNPVAHTRRPHVDRDESPTRGLDHDEAKVMLITARESFSKRDRVAIYLMLLDGLRRGAVANLDVEDLGYEAGHRTIRYRKKGGGHRQVPLPPMVAAAIDDYLDGRTTGPLIQTRTGRRVDGTALFRLVRRCAERAGIHDPTTVSPHSLRHAFITLSLEAGVPLHVVQDAAGQSDPRTTRVYDRKRGRLDKHPGYLLASQLAD